MTAWNGGSTSLAGVADVAAGATSARSHELVEAPEEVATGREGRWMVTLTLEGGEFSLGSVWLPLEWLEVVVLL